MARLAVYGAISAALAGGVIASSFAQRSNFYAACVYLYQSNACMMVILNLGMFLTIIAGQLVQMIFFGNLRTLEVEHLYERAWYAVTETCLAMTIFKDEFKTPFVVMFTFLLFLKVFHWLCQDRVDSMEQSPEIPMSFHVRMVTMIALLVTVDMLMILHAAEVVMTTKPGMMIMFGFEYTLLVTDLMASFGKYVLHTIDMRREEPWENKSMLLFYLDLVADFVKLVTYLIFFMVILFTSGLPLHIIRDVYMTMRSFIQKCKDLIQYRKATQNMNERYPDASAAELSALSDPICIICREEMVGNTPPQLQGHTLAPNPAPNPAPAEPAPRTGSGTTVPKKLPCGHIFHFHCLKSWLERQQSCPTCRRLVLDPPTPASTPMPAQGADAAAGGANNGAAPAGPGAGQPPQIFPGQGNQMGGFPMVYAPQGHYPLAGWHPHVLGGAQGAGAGAGAAGAAIPGGIPNDATAGATTNTGASAGTTPTPVEGGQGGVGIAPGVQMPGAMPWAHANYIPHYSIPHVNHPIPGLIPLFPVQARHGGGGAPEANDGGNGLPVGASTPLATSAPDNFQRPSLSTEQIPLTSLDALSENQLHYLEQNTRRALQERLRILQAVESQIVQSMTLLTQAIGALPPSPPPPPFAEELSTADPPSPQMAPSTSETKASRTWVFGSNMAGSSMSSSTVGLQSLTRGLNPSTLSGSNSGSEAGSLSTAVSPLPPTAQGTITSAEVDGKSSDTKEEEEESSFRVDKGKGKKKELDISEERAADQNGMINSEDDIEMMDVDDEEDGKYSPQETVRRRWAKISVADTAASLQ
ncbi:E3 ubiquitin-protein ligase hrd1 [Podila epicladia]|nr:E3 ubiquitin-protein ligase hrd1 [Podila epicladia]